MSKTRYVDFKWLFLLETPQCDSRSLLGSSGPPAPAYIVGVDVRGQGCRDHGSGTAGNRIVCFTYLCFHFQRERVPEPVLLCHGWYLQRHRRQRQHYSLPLSVARESPQSFLKILSVLRFKFREHLSTVHIIRADTCSQSKSKSWSRPRQLVCIHARLLTF